MKAITPLFYGVVNKGKLTLQKADEFKETLSKFEGKEVALHITKAEYVRTGQENRYMWGVVIRMIAEEMAILPEEAHDFLKSLFLKVGVDANGKRYEITKSTASLSIGDFEDYLEKVRQWAASELEIHIPLPNEVSLDDL